MIIHYQWKRQRKHDKLLKIKRIKKVRNRLHLYIRMTRVDTSANLQICFRLYLPFQIVYIILHLLVSLCIYLYTLACIHIQANFLYNLVKSLLIHYYLSIYL